MTMYGTGPSLVVMGRGCTTAASSISELSRTAELLCQLLLYEGRKGDHDSVGRASVGFLPADVPPCQPWSINGAKPNVRTDSAIDKVGSRSLLAR